MSSPPLRERALRLLARREHSRAELARKLKLHAEPEDDLDALLEDLARRKLLSDERYAEGRAHTLSRKFGASRIAYDLRAKGIATELAEKNAGIARSTEVERAREVWRRKFGRVAATAQERSKQIRFLQGRGFSFDAIRSVIGRTDDD